MPDAPQTEEVAFEEALAKLETIVAEMEGGKLTLDASMKRFEEGMKLVQTCTERLSQAEKKVEVLMRKADGSVGWTDLPTDTGDDDDGDGDEPV